MQARWRDPVIADAHSEWIEAEMVQRATSEGTIQKQLRTLFARFGIAETIVSDNGPCFVSREFEQFLKGNGVTHMH